MPRSLSRPRAGERRATADGGECAAVAVRPGFAWEKVRQRVADGFFPADQVAVPGWALAVITAGCAVLAATRLGSSGLNTFWGEDGEIFYQGALTHPLQAYFESYRGYLSTAPRVVGTVVALFPVSQAALANTVTDAVVMGLLAALIYRACAEHIRNPWVRAVPAVVTAVCPVGQETWEATTNLQWPMFFVAFTVLLWNPRRPVPVAVGAVSVLLAALTSPFGLLLAPLAVVRVIALGRGRGWVIPLAFLAGVVVQTADMAVVGGRQTSSALLPLGLVEQRYAEFVAGQGFFGTRHPLPWLPLGNAVVIALLAALALVAASGRLRPFLLGALAMAYSAVFFVLLLVLTQGPGPVVLVYPPRYNVCPLLLLAYSVAVPLDAGLRGHAGWEPGRLRTAARRRLAELPRFTAVALCAVLAGSLGWSVITNRNLMDTARQQPTWSGALANARAECGQGARTVQVPITPHTAYNWHVTLTCAQLMPH